MIDELIKLANQSNKQVKGALVKGAAKTTILFLKTNIKLVVWIIAIKDEAKMLCFDQKRHIGGKNTLL